MSSASSPQTRSSQAPSPVAAAPARIMIYIVEDDLAVRGALRMLVRSFGWDAVTFDNGLQFLAQPPREDRSCLVLDLNMPGLDGESVLQRLRAAGSRLPVLLITGDREGPRLERAMRSGAQKLLLKPFGDEAFQRAIQDCMAPTT